MAIIWFTFSVWTGYFIVRLSMTGVWIYICLVYMISLRSIKKTMQKLESKNDKDGLLQNKFLVRFYFFIYLFILLICLSILVIIVPHRSNFTEDTLNKKAC